MLELFNEYKNSDKIAETLLVGKNMVNRYPQDERMFDAYFAYLCGFAERLPALSDRQHFAQLAEVTLAFYEENASLSTDVVSKISQYHKRLNSIFSVISEAQSESIKKESYVLQSRNKEKLKELLSLKDSLRKAKSQQTFDKIISQITKIDGEIDKSVLSNEQQTSYDALTKNLTEVVSEKMREFEQRNNVAYNKDAVNSFSDAFQRFKKDSAQFKNQAALFSLVSETLFKYDASRLFNETLIYYNHVYSFIFAKLDDDGKLALTRFSIECEKKLR